MNTLIDALTTDDVKTENGMLTHSSSNDALLDLFFTIGAMRAADENRIRTKFSAAYAENPDIAMKILFWARDIRGGAGERRVFNVIATWLSNNFKDSIIKNLKNIPEYGTWKDLIYLYEHTKYQKVKKEIVELIRIALIIDKNQLAAKWLPREKKTNKQIVKNLRDDLGFSAREYRKILVELTNVVETNMCQKTWDKINYSHVPSLAMSRYKKSFYKRDENRFESWIEDVKSGKNGAKINAGAVYPYDVIKSLVNSDVKDRSVAEEQWKSLPNYFEDNKSRIMPLIDTSGSMNSLVSSGGTVTCMQVAVSLGLYISERNIGPYKDYFITFSSNPKLQKIQGATLYDKYLNISRADWSGSTNLIAAFDLILDAAIKNKVPESDMPSTILVLSDMEFNSSYIEDRSYNAIDSIDIKYKNAGYRRPNVVFWNIQSRQDNVPVKKDKSGTALISGFSPSIVRSILDLSLDPLKVMYKTIESDRYKDIVS